MSTKELGGNLSAAGLKFVVVVSRFNDFLTKQLLSGCIDCLSRHGASEDDVTVVWVPGANEIPMTVDKVSRNGGVDALIALGAVVQGATPHADFINGQVSKSLSRTAIEQGVPVINGVVCANNLEQAIERSGTKAGNKGWNAAQSAVEMANLYKSL